MSDESNPLSASALNAAMESLGLRDLQFEAVGDRPVLRRTYDEMSLEHFIGLLLTGVGAGHLQRVELGDRLAELEQQVRALGANDEDASARAAAAERIRSEIAELRRTLGIPLLTRYRGQVVVPNLKIGVLEPDEDLS